jgi:putative ABC transport system substrate-binding protein
MRRREFLGVIGLAATWPLLARARNAQRVRIGILTPANPEPFFGTFREAMRGLGYAEGENLEFVFRSADGNPRLLAPLAAELLDLKVDIIVAAQTPAVTAAKQLTTEIPIVMASAGDPVGTGLVQSLGRPGGNITGMSGTTTEMGGKLLELIREFLPDSNRVSVLANGVDPFTRPFLGQIEAGGRALSITVLPITVYGADELDSAFARAATERIHAMIVQPSLPRRPAIDLALKHRIPAISPASLFGREGGLISYSADQVALYRRAATFVDRIIKGANPSELPVEQPTKFELVVNLKTAKNLGLQLPPTLLARADEVIE